MNDVGTKGQGVLMFGWFLQVLRRLVKATEDMLLGACLRKVEIYPRETLGHSEERGGGTSLVRRIWKVHRSSGETRATMEEEASRAVFITTRLG